MQFWFNRTAEVLAALFAAFAVYIAGFGIFDTIIVFGSVALLGIAIALLQMAAGNREDPDAPSVDGSS